MNEFRIQRNQQAVQGIPTGRIKNLEDTRLIRVNTEKITVSATQPQNPSINDLWVDIS